MQYCLSGKGAQDTPCLPSRAGREYSAARHCVPSGDVMKPGDHMAAKDRLKKALDSINEVLREVQRLQPSVPPLSQRVRNQLQITTRKLKSAASEIETAMREPD